MIIKYLDGINKVNRKEYLQEWQENIDIIFSKENMNKLNFAKSTTKNEIKRENFIYSFLSSIRQKMQIKRK